MRTRSGRSLCALSLCTLLAAGCGGGGGADPLPGTGGAGGASNDASANGGATPDAAANGGAVADPDASAITPDASAITPDAAAITPDAAAITPDAALPVTDAATPTPDAGPPVEVGEPVVPQAVALIALDEASMRPMEVRFDRGIPTIVRVDVPVAPEPNGDTLLQGLEFLSRFKDVYGLRDPVEQLYLDRKTTRGDDGLKHLYFRQRHQGMPVFGAALNVQLAGDHVRMTHGHWLPDLPAFAPPMLDGPGAVNRAIGPLGGTLRVLGKAVRGIVDVSNDPAAPAEPRQVYRVTLVGADEAEARGMWIYYLDADTGAVLKRLTQIMDVGEWKDLDVQTANGTDSDTCWLGPSETDDDYWFTEDGPDGYDPATDTYGDGQRAYDLGHAILDFFEAEFGLRSYDGSESQFEIVTNVGQGYSNAAFQSPCDQIKAGYTWVQDDLLTHEFTHGIDVHAEDLDYENQSGALDESFADVFAYLFDPANTTFGEDLDPAVTGRRPPLRDLANPPAFMDPDHMSAASSGDGIGLRTIAANSPAGCGSDPAQCNDQGFVHTNSGIPNKVATLLVLGGQHTGRIIEAIGPSKVGKLYMSVLRDGVSSDTSFGEARDLFVDRAQHWAETGHAGFDLNDLCQVRNAWASVGIGESGGDADCDGQTDGADADNDQDGVPDAQDNCPNLMNWGQGDLDRDGIGNECDADLDRDTIPNVVDNCPLVSNASQDDADADGAGDLCDDADKDGVIESRDNCPNIANWDQADLDMDGEGDACEDDWDGDVATNDVDNCPLVRNFGQENADDDAFGDACDNCVAVFNDSQADCDGDGTGQACEAPGDPEHFLPVDCDPSFGIQLAQVTVLPGDLVTLPACNGCDLDNRFEGILNEVTVALPAGQTISVVDERGFRLGDVRDVPSAFGGVHEMVATFPARSGAAYFEPGASGGAGYAGRQYFLQVTPALGGVGAAFNLNVQMESFEAP
jgi:Zn-dependent metalloprotease